MNGISIKQDDIIYSEELLAKSMLYENFNNDVWVIPNFNTGENIRFEFDSMLLGKYQNILKTYIYTELCRSVAPKTLNGKHLNILRLFRLGIDLEELTYDDIIESEIKVSIVAHHWARFLEFAKVDNDELINSLKKFKYNRHDPRSVPAFVSMYRYDDIIKDFIETADEENLRFYYPIVLWWNIGGVIPMRATEFTLLTKNCLIEKDNTCFISIPTIKKKFTQDVQYEQFAITDELASLIRRYIEMVEYDYKRKYLFSELEFERAFNRVNDITGMQRDFVNANDLRRLQKLFNEEIVEKRYGKHIVEKGEKLGADDIEDIQLGDLRHFAMFNLLDAGLDPYIIAKCARHDNLSTQTNYCGHLKNMAMGKMQVIAEKITMNAGTNIGVNQNEILTVFDERALKVRERVSEVNTPHKVHNGLCYGNLECPDGVTCLLCPHFKPNDEEKHYKELAKSQYQEEINKLTDICETMRQILESRQGYTKLKQLANLKNTAINRAAIAKSRLEVSNG